MEVQVRLPAAQSVETVQINPDSRVTEGVNVIVQKLAAVNLEDARLVIAPTTRKNGSILSPQVTFRSINFNPKEVRFRTIKFNPTILPIMCIFIQLLIGD